MNKHYDFLIVGAGLTGSVCAHELNKLGYKVLVIDEHNHVGGMIYSYNDEGIEVHKYGPHIFHTSDKETWDYVNQFDEFLPYIHQPVAKYKGEIYNLPFNMNTFVQLWPNEKDLYNKLISECIFINNPKNVEEQALSQVGKTVYEKLIKGYTEKQWGKKCTELPSEILKRIPIRFEYNNNYFNDKYQGIPKHGYTYIINKLLAGIDIKLNTKYSNELTDLADKVIYTGAIDRFFDYCYGSLDYRYIDFKIEKLNQEYYQQCAVVNYTDTDIDIPWTRITEFKYFTDTISNKTIIMKEYSGQGECCYPVQTEKNIELYSKYFNLTPKNIYFLGRLAEYKYYDMDKVIRNSLDFVKKLVL